MLVLISMVALADDVGSMTCTATTSWMARSTGPDGATAAEGQQWTQSLTGLESEVTETLKSECKAAKDAEDDGWTKGEFGSCQITCEATFSVSLHSKVTKGGAELQEAMNSLRSRLEIGLERCVHLAQDKSEPVPSPFSFHSRIVKNHLQGGMTVPDSPVFTGCLEEVLSKPRFQEEGAVAFVLSVKTKEPTQEPDSLDLGLIKE